MPVNYGKPFSSRIRKEKVPLSFPPDRRKYSLDFPPAFL